MVLTALNASFQAISIASIMPFITIIINPEIIHTNSALKWFYEILHFSSDDSFIFFFGVVIFFLIIISNSVTALATWYKLQFVFENNHSISKRLLTKYLSQPYCFFLNKSSADLSKNILDEINQMSNGFLIPLINYITGILLVIVVFSMLLWINFAITLVALFVLGGPYILVYYFTHSKTKSRGKDRMVSNKERYKIISEAFGGIKDIKIAGNEFFFIRRYAKASKKFTSGISNNAIIGELPRYALECIAFGGVVILILVMLSLHQNLQSIIPLISVFIFAGYRVMPSLQQVFLSYTKMAFYHASLENIYREMQECRKTDASAYLPVDRTFTIPFKNTINLENISFSYPKTSNPTLHNINLTIFHNTTVAFVGRTGAGKTTLADILLGLLQPTEGKLKVDDVIITPENVRLWQQNIGYVPQHIYLSDDTVTRNIAFGIDDSDINFEQVKQSAKIANIDRFIETETSNGYDTIIGERGIRLSGGQRQRIGIARALYHNPEVILLDEATSSLDGLTEQAFIEALINAAKVKTIIVIAHRLNTIRHSDIIYILEKGMIIAYGTFDELMTTNAQFQAMGKHIPKDDEKIE